MSDGLGRPVAIVGAGFSGTLLTINLIRQGTPVVLIERSSEQIAKGLAFGTKDPEHLLNVRAANMSAFPDDAASFLRWIGHGKSDQANRFAPRLTYGLYLRDLLLKALAKAGAKALILNAEVVGACFDAAGVSLTLNNGGVINARSLVLALGTFPPGPQPLLAGLPSETYFPDPWNPGVAALSAELDHILLLGSGLTAVDVILSLDRAGFQGRITVLSRRGLKPLAHAEAGPRVENVSAPEQRGSALLRHVRARAEAIGWRAAVDELRPHTQNLWRWHDSAMQRSFLRHLRPYWDVHRHRLAPAVAQRIEALQGKGRLCFIAGKLVASRPVDQAIEIEYRSRGSDKVLALTANRVINCTGPGSDPALIPAPLIRDLLRQGRIRPDEHRLGLDVDHLGRARDAQGEAQNGLLVIGPMTRGEAWENIAVPDIRRQVWNMARYLANAHWVGGEGL